MNIKLFFQAIIKFILGVLIVGSLLFIPANTINYWNRWLFMGLLFVPMFISGIVLMIKNPELLRKRLTKYIPKDMPTGKILGKVTLVDCVKIPSEFKETLLKENKEIYEHISERSYNRNKNILIASLEAIKENDFNTITVMVRRINTKH